MDNIEALQKAAKSPDGCVLQQALDEIPWENRLQAVKDLQTTVGASSKVVIEIAPGSTSQDFAFRVDGSNAAQLDFNAISEKMKKSGIDISPEALKQMAESHGKTNGPRLLLSESFNFDIKVETSPQSLNLKFKFGTREECHGP